MCLGRAEKSRDAERGTRKERSTGLGHVASTTRIKHCCWTVGDKVWCTDRLWDWFFVCPSPTNVFTEHPTIWKTSLDPTYVSRVQSRQYWQLLPPYSEHFVIELLCSDSERTAAPSETLFHATPNRLVGLIEFNAYCIVLGSGPKTAPGGFLLSLMGLNQNKLKAQSQILPPSQFADHFDFELFTYTKLY